MQRKLFSCELILLKLNILALDILFYVVNKKNFQIFDMNSLFLKLQTWIKIYEDIGPQALSQIMKVYGSLY